MNAACAVSLKVGPLMPGAAACAVAVNSKASASITTGSSLDIEIAFFIFVSLIASLLALIAALLISNTDLGHEPAEIFGVVRQVVQVGGIEVEHAARRVAGGI